MAKFERKPTKIVKARKADTIGQPCNISSSADLIASEWVKRLELKERAMSFDYIQKATDDVSDFANFLTSEKGWDWGELYCELTDLVRKKSPVTFLEWHKMLKNFAVKAGYVGKVRGK